MINSIGLQAENGDAFLERKAPYDLIVFAASAGGLAALREVFRALPPDLDVPLVVVQHRSTAHPQVLPRILARTTSYRVKQAEDGDRLLSKTIYLAPPDYHVVVQPDRTLSLVDGRRIKFLRSSANPLFESAAESLHGRVIAVVLTGGGSDATDGVQTVRSMGGVVIAQDPAQAEHPSMPAAAIRSGAVQYVVPLADIAPLLAKLMRPGTARREDALDLAK